MTTTPIKNSSYYLKTPDAPMKLVNSTRLRADAPVFIPKHNLWSNSEFVTEFVSEFATRFDNEIDEIDEIDSEIDEIDEIDSESDETDETDNSYILYNGEHYLYSGEKFDSFDKASDAKHIEDNEYVEISAMILASMNEMSTQLA